ncbi:uracil-DNA glycosylase [Salsipaludibacter albus]|uniref:uracil-DNA glycosylase n=1 Tax=Salsipaludibacter albus TaxID=2849650 RepID=UPI001EE460DF|nr:uracil-DNA glycosylase [Salsipaludibacter albus]MBY5162787.1 uracil-DNA glycosylase [Salsipaludibacter albus]
MTTHHSDDAVPASTDRLGAVATGVADCRRCPRLVTHRERVAVDKRAAFADQDYWGRGVPGFGDPDADLLVVGLAPAAHGANRTGRMFTGDRSGDMLFASLHRVGLANQPTATHAGDGLELRRTWVTSPVKCAPPGNRPTTTERDTCVSTWLVDELALLDPTVLVALGGFAWDVCCRLGGWDGRKPRFGHGAEARLADGRALVASYHVSQLNTFTGRLTDEMLDDVFRRALELADG